MTSPQGAADIASALRGSTMAPPTVDPTAGFAVLTQVHFQSGRTELGADAKAALDGLATRLLANEERVRLAAFSGAPGDMSSEARRLSLERAIAVRAYLESKGVPASRVDLLSFGGAVHGASDRVDVLIRST
jgi:outer membrane protein OmpA-like peptidoglycan-associated protein